MPRGVYKKSEEHKRHISEARKGMKLSEEHKRKLSEKRRGRVHSDESRKKMSEAHKGMIFTDEWCRKISEALRGEKNPHYGKTLPDETKLKISESVKRAKADPKCRIRQSEISKKNWADPDYRRRMSEFWSGENSPILRGDKHPFWKGGVSFEPYCPKFNTSFKERVRDFFGRVCVECGAPENGKRLHIHHVNFNKMACCDGTKPLFVALCNSCHAKTNYNREYWEEHFTNMIEELYGGECYIRKKGA